MNVQRLKNWNEIVRDLKAGPDFAIHGTPYANWGAMKREADYGRCVMGHTLYMSDQERRMTDQEFYTSLSASVKIAVGFSKALMGGVNISSKRYNFDGPPFVIIGVDVMNKGWLKRQREVSPRQSYLPWLNASTADNAFRVGHDFIDLRLEGILIEDRELDKINVQLRRFLERHKHGFRMEISGEYLVEQKVIERMIEKIHARIQEV